jgi:hypothetical protein
MNSRSTDGTRDDLHRFIARAVTADVLQIAPAAHEHSVPGEKRLIRERSGESLVEIGHHLRYALLRQPVFADEVADEAGSAGEDKPSGERNAGEFWHSDGAMKSFWHSFGTVEGVIGLLGNIPALKSRIINTHKRSGRSAAW